jgi:hypothetical protein
MGGVAQDTNGRLATLVQAERSVWRALLSGDAAADAALLDDAFLGVYPTGFATRDDHAAQLSQGPTVAAFRLEEPRLLDLAPDLALLAYRAVFTRPGTPDPETMYVSSLWRRDGATWRNLFSQDTPAGPPVP